MILALMSHGISSSSSASDSLMTIFPKYWTRRIIFTN